MLGYMEKGIQTPMAQGRSTKIIEMIKLIRTSRLSIKKFLSLLIRERRRRAARTARDLPEPPYCGTSVIRNSAPLGPYSRTMPRVL